MGKLTKKDSERLDDLIVTIKYLEKSLEQERDEKHEDFLAHQTELEKYRSQVQHLRVVLRDMLLDEEYY